MADKDKGYYVVDLSGLPLERIGRINQLELEFSLSDRGAVSHALGRKINPELTKDLRSIYIGKAMNTLDQSYGGAGNFAYQIPTDIHDDKGKRLTAHEFNIAQEVFLAEEIASKIGGNAPNYMGRARKYLEFYKQERAKYSPENQ